MYTSPSFRFLVVALGLLWFPTALAGQLAQHFQQLARTQVQYLVDNNEQLFTGKANTKALLFYPSPETPLNDQLNTLRQQLVNLPVFSQATWALDTVGGETIVNWTMEESRTVFPLLNFGGIRGNTYYQVGFNDIHFRGRGQQLTAFYQNNDGEHNYYLSLRNTNLRGSRWGYALETRRYAAIEPLYFPDAAVNYRYANLSFGADASYTLQPGNILTLGVSTFQERYRKLNPEQENLPGPNRVNQQKLLLKASRTHDQLNYFAERSSGVHHQTIAQFVHNFADQTDFLIAWHDFRFFRLLGQRGNLAGRLRTGISSNNDSPFAPFVLDSQVNIRGSGNRIDRGTAQLILNLEYRHTVWRDRRERFAAQLVGFSDLGTWRSPGGELSDLVAEENIRHFLGAGLRLISLKAHNAVLRLDYGLDVRNTQERGFVAGFGQYF